MLRAPITPMKPIQINPRELVSAITRIGSQTDSVVLLDCVEQAPDARWTSASSRLPFPGAANDDRGFARILQNVQLEDGKTYEKVLQTHPRRLPHGAIIGRCQNLTVPQAGAEFRANIGFLKGAEASDGVYFEVWAEFPEFEGTLVRRSYHKPYSEYLIHGFQQDLSRFRGLTGSIALTVEAGSESSTQDWAVWVEPKVVSLEHEYAFASFVGCAIGSGRNGNRLLNAWGGKSDLLYGDLSLHLEFAHVRSELPLRLDSHGEGQFIGAKQLGSIRPGTTATSHTIHRTRLGRWTEQIIFNGTYLGEISYTVNNVGE